VVKSYSPDLILMDVMLGSLNGLKLYSELKLDPYSNSIPVIIISASHDIREMEINQCMAKGFIPKPFELDFFIDKVGQIAGVK
jgi:CheY-like chemotaxis protein